jgi:serine/threonine protein kinase
MLEQTIFTEALEMEDPAQRAAFLEAACAGDARLRQRVERLLGRHDHAGSFLEQPALSCAATANYQPLISEQPGTSIGPYKLLQQIGEGGFGVVFLAEQERPVKRRVALKVIKPGMDSRQVTARFEAERQALAMMDHPNIAKVHDAGATENGRPYFVMELVQGVPITEYCDQCNLTTRERLKLFVMVCQAVQHAHQQGVIHRDIKPTNVLIAMQDGKATPKIIDFGVAKAINQQLTEHTLLTSFAQIIGTPLYMSPEQAELSPLGVDTRSDIYSLGVLLYELLAGTTPFDKDRLHAASYDELRRIIREEEPPRPSARISTLAPDLAATVAEHRRTEVRRLRQQVRGELDWIVMKCLEKDRNRRYETPNSMARDIERYLGSEPVQACPPSVRYRFRKFAARNKTLLSAAGAILASLIVGLGVSTWMYLRERAAVQVATANEARARKESARAESVSNFLQEMVGSADTEQAKGKDYTVRELLDDFSAGMGTQLADQPEVEADLHATIGRAYHSLRLQDRAQPHFERAIALRRQLDGQKSEALASILIDNAWNLADQSKYSEAEAQLREALEIHRVNGVEDEKVMHALRVLQNVLISSGSDDDAELITQQALEIAQRSGTESADFASILHRYSELKVRQGHFAEGEQLARRAVDMHLRLQGKRHPETAWGLVALASALLAQQKLDEAESVVRESLAVFRQSYPEGHPNFNYATSMLVSILDMRGDRAGLQAIAEAKARQLATSDGPNDWVRLAEILLNADDPNDAAKAEAHRLIRRANARYGQLANDSRDNLIVRLQVLRGYSNVARICGPRNDFAQEYGEVEGRLNAEFPELIAAFPDRAAKVEILYNLAFSRLQSGDEAGYRDACMALSGVPPGAGINVTEFERVLVLCLVPKGLNDSHVAREQAEEAARTTPHNSGDFVALGLALYRDGQYEQAAQRLEGSIIALGEGEVLSICPKLVLAMTKWRQGRTDEARVLLATAQAALNEVQQSQLIGWDERITTELLRREASMLIDQERIGKVESEESASGKPISRKRSSDRP